MGENQWDCYGKKGIYICMNGERGGGYLGEPPMLLKGVRAPPVSASSSKAICAFRAVVISQSVSQSVSQAVSQSMVVHRPSRYSKGVDEY